MLCSILLLPIFGSSITVDAGEKKWGAMVSRVIKQLDVTRELLVSRNSETILQKLLMESEDARYDIYVRIFF